MEVDVMVVILLAAGVLLARRVIKRKNRIVPKKEIEMKDVDNTKFTSDGPFISQ